MPISAGAGKRARLACPKQTRSCLARAQFAFTIGFHIVLPALTIGLASYLAVLEALWFTTGRQVYRDVFQVLAAGVRRRVRHGRRLRRGHGVRVRHQLGALLRQDRRGDRPADGLRGDDGILPGSRLPRHPAVRPATRWARRLFRRHASGGGRHADQRVLDPGGEFLDADAAGLHVSPPMAGSCPPTGGRSCSIRLSRIASCTW